MGAWTIADYTMIMVHSSKDDNDNDDNEFHSSVFDNMY
jgi:hypothetical protein